MYSIDGLKNGIVNSKKNIKVLEKVIQDERQNIKEYKIMIDSIETAEKKKAEAEAGIHIEVQHDS